MKKREARKRDFRGDLSITHTAEPPEQPPPAGAERNAGRMRPTGAQEASPAGTADAAGTVAA